MVLQLPLTWIRGELIARGVTGRVYVSLADTATSKELLVVKQILPPPVIATLRQRSLLSDLRQESETLKTLVHPKLVQYIGFEEMASTLNM